MNCLCYNCPRLNCLCLCNIAPQWATAAKLTTSISDYTAKLGVSPERAYQLYKSHGTCLKGLLAEGLIDKDTGAEDFLLAVHLIDYSDISLDPVLQATLERLRLPTWIFTASTREHAGRCLDKLGFSGIPFRGIVDTRTCGLETKHSDASFQAAMVAAGVSDPAGCVLCDDSVKNIQAAKKMGWTTVLVGKVDRDTGAPVQCAAADAHIETLHSLPDVLPELFEP